MKRRIFFVLFAAIACCSCIPLLNAAGATEAKARMRERVAAIDRLKIGEFIGENNRGFLDVRKADKEANAVVAAENQDRTIVFSEAAANAGSTADAFGRAFARQIAQASKPGVWLQNEKGEWYKK
jgi:hypothetical protein